MGPIHNLHELNHVLESARVPRFRSLANGLVNTPVETFHVSFFIERLDLD